MKKILLSLALASLALGGWGMLGGTPSAVPPDQAPAVSPPDSTLAPVLPEAGCAEPDVLLLPEGVEPGAQQACCIDECSRDRDCRFICGKEFGGQCVQVNSCCRQCACLGFAPSPGLPS